MNSTAPLTDLQLSCNGFDLKMDEDHFGFLKSSIDLVGNHDALQQRMKEDGYLYLPGLLDRDKIIEARREVINRLEKKGFLHPDRDPMDGILKPDTQPSFDASLAQENKALLDSIYGERMIQFYTTFLGGKVRHFDFTWFRSMGTGRGTCPHCDIVYMGRGTHDLYTAWVPYGDVTLDVGGLMILEDSHKKSDRIKNYLESDVDSYCVNRRHAEEIESGQKQWSHDGKLSTNANSLQKNLGGRWLTAEYRMGDVLTFTMRTVHAGIDNQSSRIRLSSDSRYQLASEPIDERWVGENPIGHSLAGKRGRIC